MASEWPEIQIGELVRRGEVTLQTGPFGSQLHKHDYIEHGVPVVPTEAIGRGLILSESVLPQITNEKASELKRHVLRRGDILFARRGAQATGLSAHVDDDHVGALCGTGAILLRLQSSTLDSKFLASFLATNEAFEWLRTHAVGAVMPNLNTGIISKLTVPVPPLSVQIEIARFMSTVECRIQLLKNEDTTLEAIAQALFKSWFIDFDPVRAKAEGCEPDGMDATTAALFPSTFEDDKAIAATPTGWSPSALYDLAQFINGAAYKAFEPNTERRGLPIIKIAELKAGVTSQTAFSEVDMPLKYRIDSNDILFSWSGNPDTSIDTFVWSHGAAWLNQHIFRVVPNAPHERSFVLLTLKYLKSTFAEIARDKQTTGLGHVTVADLKRLRVVKPDMPLLKEWNKLVDPLIERAFVTQQQAQSLVQLRDTLLPRLISGKLRLPVAQTLIEEAIA